MKHPLLIAALLATPAMAADAPVNPLSKEPFYAAIVKDAGRLKGRSESFGKAPSLSLLSSSAFKSYARDIRQLSERNLKGHMDLKARGTDNDLKCVLKGVSVDLPLKLEAIEASKTPEALKGAFDDMAYLLEDNIDVIVTPATADSGLDCVIEFGNS
ncbi:MAG: hypothetical protein QM667_00290 [Asticcacaulis sp.]